MQFGAHLLQDGHVLRFVVSNGESNSARHQGQCESRDDTRVRHRFFQTPDTLAVDEKQQRHRTKGGHVGAGGHDDAGRTRAEQATCGWKGLDSM